MIFRLSYLPVFPNGFCDLVLSTLTYFAFLANNFVVKFRNGYSINLQVHPARSTITRGGR